MRIWTRSYDLSLTHIFIDPTSFLSLSNFIIFINLCKHLKSYLLSINYFSFLILLSLLHEGNNSIISENDELFIKLIFRLL